jgi:hypothetical protein
MQQLCLQDRTACAKAAKTTAGERKSCTHVIRQLACLLQLLRQTFAVAEIWLIHGQA